jgi:hypothetical protein
VPILPRKDSMRVDAQELIISAAAVDRKETQKETSARPEDGQRIA